MSDQKIATTETRRSSRRAQKESIVAKLREKGERARSLVFTNYQGLTHKQLEELKKAIKKVDAELVIAKNSLLNLALKDKSSKTSDQKLEGPTATVFVYSDIMEPLKELAKSIKQFNLPTLKFGIQEGLVLTGDQLLKLATLPSKEVLLAQVAVGLQSPISGFVHALNWNIKKLVMTLKAIENKQSLRPDGLSK